MSAAPAAPVAKTAPAGSVVDTLGVPPPPEASSSDDEAYERPPLPPLPTHLFGFAVKRVLKRNLLALVVERFAMYDASLPTTPPVPRAWSDDEPSSSGDEAGGLGCSRAGGSGSGSGDGSASGGSTGSGSSEVSSSADGEAGGGAPKPAWLADAINSDSDGEPSGPSGGGSGPVGGPALPDYFEGAGDELGLEVWRVIKGVPTRLAADEYGTFYKGDAYIVLGVEEAQFSKVYSLHFWIGESCPLDQKLAATMTAQGLGRSLGTRAVREDCGDESKKFRELFWFGMSYEDGGSATGLKKVVKKKTLSLYQLKGRVKPKVCKLPVQIESLNAGDVFLLDSGDTIWQLNGPDARMREKGKALDMITVIKSDERSGPVRTVIINHDGVAGRALTDDERAFFSVLAEGSDDGGGVAFDPDAGFPDLGQPTETDDEFEARVVSSIKLNRVAQSSSGKLSLEVVGEGLLRRSRLDPSDAYILDSATGIYAWVGKTSSDLQRAAAMQIAKLYHTQQERPEWQPVTRVVEGAEPFLFQESFKGWHKAKARAKAKAAKDKLRARRAAAKAAREKAKQIATPIKSLLKARVEPARDTVTDDPGGGKLTVMVLESDTVQYVLPQSLYGHFYTGDVFLVIYYYQTEETATAMAETKCVIYFWEGSGADKRVWLAFQHSPLKARLAEAMKPEVIRIAESRESPHFRSLFSGQTIVHYGHLTSFVPLPRARLLDSDAPGFVAKYGDMEPDATFNADALLPPTGHLYHVKGFGPGHIFVHEVPLAAEQLDANDAFVALTPADGAFVWIGQYASSDEEAMAKFTAGEVVALANTQHLAGMDEAAAADDFIMSHIVVVREGKERDAWWDLFGGARDYVTPGDPDFAPRLYVCKQGKEGFEIGFMGDSGLSFDDLDSRSVHMLDVFSTLYVWSGSLAHRNDSKMAKQAATEYVEAALDGRGGCPVKAIVQGSEPVVFKKQFLDWPHHQGSNPGGQDASVFVDPRAKREAELAQRAALQKAAAADALANNKCTIRATGYELNVFQTWYQCVTCGIEGDLVGVCASCAAVCHAGHTLSDPREDFFFCTCASKVTDQAVDCQCLPPAPSEEALPPTPS